MKVSLTNINMAEVTENDTPGTDQVTNPDEVPIELRQWNWGAFFLTWVWGITHGVWISLLAFVPLVNLALPFYLGAKGNELAWKTGRWTDRADFLSRQKKWAWAGLIIFILSVVTTFYLLFFTVRVAKNAATTVGNAVQSTLEDMSAGRKVADSYLEAARTNPSQAATFASPSFGKYLSSKGNDPWKPLAVPPSAHDCKSTSTGISYENSETKVKVDVACTDGKATFNRQFEMVKVGEEWKVDYVRTIVPSASPTPRP